MGRATLTAIRENGATSGVGVLATYGYDPLGRRTSLTFGNGEKTLYAYDGVSRLASLTHDLGGTLTTNDNAIAFTYNPASQIVGRTASNSAYAWTGHGSGSASSTSDGLNRLTAQGGTGFGYDAKGNMASDGTRTFSYDSENRLADTSATIPYYYDPLGRLAGAGAPIAVHYENYVDGLIAERLAGSSSVSMRHVFGPGTDEPIVWYLGSGTSDRRFLHADERGSIVAVTAENKSLLAINRYDEYGRTQTSGSNFGRFLYTGQRYFAGIDLYYYKARFYHPNAGGRFLQVDPIGYGGGMNLYAYVGGDPVNFTDPLGLKRKNKPDVKVYHDGSGGGGGGYQTITVTAIVEKAMRDTLIMLNRIDTARALSVSQGTNSGPNENSDADGDGRPDPDIEVNGTPQLAVNPIVFTPGYVVPEVLTHRGTPLPDSCVLVPNSNGAYMRCGDGKIHLTPDYAEQACKDYRTMMRSNNDINSGSYLFGLGTLLFGAKVPSPLLGPGIVIDAMVGGVTTLLSYAPPPPGCK